MAVNLERVQRRAACQRMCGLSETYRLDVLVHRFTHNGVRVCESVDIDDVRMQTSEMIEDALVFWLAEQHAGRPPARRGYEMPVAREDGTPTIAVIPVVV